MATDDWEDDLAFNKVMLDQHNTKWKEHHENQLIWCEDIAKTAHKRAKKLANDDKLEGFKIGENTAIKKEGMLSTKLGWYNVAPWLKVSLNYFLKRIL